MSASRRDLARRSVVYSYAKFLTDARTKFRTRALPGKRSQSKTEIAEVIFSRNKRSSSGDVNFRWSSVEAGADENGNLRSMSVLSRAQVASSRLFRCVLLRARVANELDSRPARSSLSLSLSPRAPLSARPVRAPAARSRVDRRLASTHGNRGSLANPEKSAPGSKIMSETNISSSAKFCRSGDTSVTSSFGANSGVR